MSHLSGAFRRAAVALGTVGMVSAATLTSAQAASAPTSMPGMAPSAAQPNAVVTVRVNANNGLFIRFGPTTDSANVGTLRNGTLVQISCRVYSQNVQGNHDWYKINHTTARWLSARFLTRLGGTPNFC